MQYLQALPEFSCEHFFHPETAVVQFLVMQFLLQAAAVLSQKNLSLVEAVVVLFRETISRPEAVY